MAPQQLRPALTLWDGMVLAIGSIAGAGILYLPSLTYVLAGQDVLVVWLGGMLLGRGNAVADRPMWSYLVVVPLRPFSGVVCRASRGSDRAT